MVRRYDSTQRRQAASETRARILRAALKLHWEGITELEPLAREAGVSLPTVRKHFPTKEALFGSCTRAFAETLVFPDLEALGGIAEPGARMEAVLTELCRVHEAMLGYAWTSARLREESQTLDRELRAYEGLIGAMAALIAPAGSARAGAVRGLLDFLTYRAMRLAGGLSPRAARDELASALEALVPEPPARPRSKQP